MAAGEWRRIGAGEYLHMPTGWRVTRQVAGGRAWWWVKTHDGVSIASGGSRRAAIKAARTRAT